MSIILSILAVGNGGNLINKSMDALQIFRVSLQFIGTSACTVAIIVSSHAYSIFLLLNPYVFSSTFIFYCP